MRLLVVTPEFPPHTGGGLLKYYELMTAAWTAAGVDVSVLVATPYSSFDDYERGGVRVVFLPLAEVHRQADRLPHLSAAPTFRRWVAAGLAAAEWVRRRHDRFDAIEVADFGLLFAPLVCLEGRPPLLVKMHGSLGQISEHEPWAPATELDFALARLTEAAMLPYADAVQAYSPANASEWRDRLGCDVAMIPPALPLPDPRDTSGAPAFTGVAVGRIQAWKGPELLCRAIQELGTSAPRQLRVAWAGRDTASGPDGTSMSDYLRSTYPGIWGERIVPTGPQDPDAVAGLQAASTFTVAPSQWDTFNFTVAESMGLGCVALASTGAGASYLIESGTNGLTFDPNDASALALHILGACDLSPARRREIGAAARDTIRRELNPATVAARSLDALARISTNAQRPAIPPVWMREFLEPNSRRNVGTGYLENVSIRELASHLKARVARKIVG